jgi:hypothetical protein
MMHINHFYESREGACLYSPRIREEFFSKIGLPIRDSRKARLTLIW